ncbi:MAG: hypothetical protein JXX14_03655 [Deltaproteobacteria bacterium]|nr:hypothetical protein [Deltaproteobacteria bacterium]
MTIPGLIIVNMLVGASVAWAARVQIRSLQRPVFSSRYFLALMMLEVMIFLPVGMYYTGFYPDWSWMYLVDTRNMQVGLTLMSLITYPVAATMGYLVGYFSARGNSDWVSVMFVMFLGLGLVGLFAVGFNKFTHLGTFDQYQNNVNLKDWTSTSLFPSIIVTWLGVGSAWGYLLYRFWKEGSISPSSGQK